MKKTCIQFLFLFLAFIGQAFAGPGDGILSITNLSRQNIFIEIDGRTYNDVTNGLILRDFRPGNHTIKVYTINRTVLVRPNRQQIIYSKSINIKPKMYIDIVVNRFGRATYDEQQIIDGRFDNDGRNDNDGRDNWNNGDGRDNNNNSNNNNNNGWPPRNNTFPPRPMDDNTFCSFIETIRRESFDDSRLAIAKSCVDQNFFTSAQAKQLIGLFSFENSKLEIAKYMYGKVTDPKNYFVVYSVFSFSKTKEELAEYVRTYKP